MDIKLVIGLFVLFLGAAYAGVSSYILTKSVTTTITLVVIPYISLVIASAFLAAALSKK